MQRNTKLLKTEAKGKNGIPLGMQRRPSKKEKNLQTGVCVFCCHLCGHFASNYFITKSLKEVQNE